MKSRLTAIVISFCTLVTQALSEETIPIQTYHSTPPFVVEEQSRLGLTYDLADILSEKSAGRFRFVASNWPRKRLNKNLENTDVLVVPWVNPTWFGDAKQTRYLWTDGYRQDSNIVLSRIDDPVDYHGPESLVGKSISVLLGARLAGIDDLIEQGKIRRETASSFESVLRMVLHSRVDATILPSPVAKYFIAKTKSQGRFYISDQSHRKYWRHFLVKGRPDVHEYLQGLVPFLLHDPQWKAVEAKYGM